MDRPAPIRDDATRRRFLIGGASLAALLADCSTTAQTSAPPAVSTGFPFTIKHKYGSTEITKTPERLRRANPQFTGATAVAAYDFGHGQLGVYGPQDPRARVLAALGFQTPARIIELVGEKFFATISAEQLQLVEADVVAWIVYTEAGKSRIQDQPVYRTLKVAKEGRDVFLVGTDPLGAAYAFSTALSLPVALDGLAPQLAAAIDGDPATKPPS